MSNIPTIPLFRLPVPDEVTDPGSGQNEKQILITTGSNAWSDELGAFLQKIITAVNCNLERDCFLLNLTQSESISFNQLRRERSFRYIISFGIEPGRLGFRFEANPYHPLTIGELTFLLADPLDELFREKDLQERKKSARLWKALQHIFHQKI